VTLPAVATTELENRYEGDLAEFRAQYITTKLADAVALIQQHYPEVEARLGDGRLLTQNYNRVVCDVVLRVIRNPGGFTNEGDGGYSYGRRVVVASGDIWLTDGDVDLLFGRVQVADMGTASVGVHVPPWSR
jgi:hypothetical protein